MGERPEALAQVGTRTVSASHIEQRNGTFRERFALLTRRTRHLQGTARMLEEGLYLIVGVHDFCHGHQRLGQQVKRTPAMAAGLTDEGWSAERLLSWFR